MKAKNLLACLAAFLVAATGFGQSAAETDAITRACELYPDANTTGSRLNKALQAKAAELRRDNPTYFENPQWPLLLIPQVAASLGIVPAAATTPAKPQRQAPIVLHQRFSDDRVEDSYRESAAALEADGKSVTSETILLHMRARLEEIRRDDAASAQAAALAGAISALQAQINQARR